MSHRVLVVGVGSIGERHVRCFKNTQRAEVEICDPSADRRATVAQTYGVKAYPDLETALAKSSAEIAVIATPAPSHIPMATQLAESGRHLLIEKPLSTTTTGAESLVATVSEQQLTCGVAYCWRYHPLFEQTHRFLADRKQGRLLQIVCQSGQCFPFYRPAYREIYYNDRSTGGGAIQDAMTHMLNLGEWFGGRINRLGADAGHQHLEGVTVEDTVHVITRQGTRDDVMGNYSLNQYQAANECNWTLVTESGLARIEMSRHRWMWQTDPDADWQIHTIAALERDTMYLAQANGFLDAVEGQDVPRCTLAEGLQSLRVNQAVLSMVDTQQSLADVHALSAESAV